MENEINPSKKDPATPESNGIDKWNDRLDENLESEHNGDELADEKARKYSEEHGSGDQSDESPDV